VFRSRQREAPNSDFAVPADLVLLALGFDAAVEASLAEQLGLAVDEAGRIAVRDNATAAADVFAAGDLVTGASLVAGAIHSGRRAADKIDAYLSRPNQ